MTVALRPRLPVAYFPVKNFRISLPICRKASPVFLPVSRNHSPMVRPCFWASRLVSFIPSLIALPVFLGLLLDRLSGLPPLLLDRPADLLIPSLIPLPVSFAPSLIP